MTSRVYVGHDAREVEAYRACVGSLRARARGEVEIHPVSSRLLGSLYTRPETRREGVLWDEISNAPMATEFSIARFFTPLLARHGWVVFCDCDFLWRASIEDLFALADERYAVMVVKHQYEPVESVKMDGQPQTSYHRKNWSSLMLLNCTMIVDNDWLPLLLLNHNTGRNLHGFSWLRDDLIGEVPVEWNWLEGVSSATVEPCAVHYTRGIPSMRGYENAAFADEWRSYGRR